MIGMATDKVTVTMERDTITTAKRSAKAAELSLSAWLDKAARAQARREAALAYAKWAATNLDDAEIAELDAETEALALQDTQQW